MESADVGGKWVSRDQMEKSRENVVEESEYPVCGFTVCAKPHVAGMIGGAELVCAGVSASKFQTAKEQHPISPTTPFIALLLTHLPQFSLSIALLPLAKMGFADFANDAGLTSESAVLHMVGFALC